MAEISTIMLNGTGSGWVLTELKDGKPIPKASGIAEIRPEADGFVSLLILAWTPTRKSTAVKPFGKT